MRAERKRELAVSSRIPSPSNAHVRDKISGVAGKIRLVFQTGTTPKRTRGEEKAEERDTTAPTAVTATPQQQKLQTASESKEETLIDWDPSREEQTPPPSPPRRSSRSCRRPLNQRRKH